MRNYIIIFVVVLSISTLMSGYSAPPSPIAVGLNGICFKHKMRANHSEGMIGEFALTDGAREWRAPGSVDDTYT